MYGGGLDELETVSSHEHDQKNIPDRFQPVELHHSRDQCDNRQDAPVRPGDDAVGLAASSEVGEAISAVGGAVQAGHMKAAAHRERYLSLRQTGRRSFQHRPDAAGLVQRAKSEVSNRALVRTAPAPPATRTSRPRLHMTRLSRPQRRHFEGPRTKRIPTPDSSGECRVGTEVGVANQPKVFSTGPEGVSSPTCRTCTYNWLRTRDSNPEPCG